MQGLLVVKNFLEVNVLTEIGDEDNLIDINGFAALTRTSALSKF